MADKDGLTGLQLRADFDATFEKAKQSEMAIVYFDVNNLKYTNDNMGHKFGDKLLCTCADALKANFRENEIFRTGGDEFIVVLEGVGPAVIEKKLKSIAELMEEKTKEDEDGVIYQIAAGFCVGDGSLSKQEIEDKAESNMYINKKELKRSHPIKGDPRGTIRPQVSYREVTVFSKPVTLPEDINENNTLIEKKYTSYVRETITKASIMVMAFAALYLYLLILA